MVIKGILEIRGPFLEKEIDKKDYNKRVKAVNKRIKELKKIRKVK